MLNLEANIDGPNIGQEILGICLHKPTDIHNRGENPDIDMREQEADTRQVEAPALRRSSPK